MGLRSSDEDGFTMGHMAAGIAERDAEIERLRAEVARLTEDRNMWQQLASDQTEFYRDVCTALGLPPSHTSDALGSIAKLRAVVEAVPRLLDAIEAHRDGVPAPVYPLTRHVRELLRTLDANDKGEGSHADNVSG